MSDGIEFGVPATCANLGPGFAVLGIALDVPLRIRVETTTADGHVIERSGTLEEPSIDPRHDPIRRGLEVAADRFAIKIPAHLRIRAESTVPPATGLGTQTAMFVAGAAIAVRHAKKPPTDDDLLDLVVELGGDPAHAGPAMAGGMTASCLRSGPGDKPAFRIVSLPLHEDWKFVLACPLVRIPTADARRILPPTLPHEAAPRSTGRLLGLLDALARGEEEDLAAFLFDEIHVPFRRRLVPGIDAAMAAAREAGAAGVTISGHGPGLVAVTTDEARTEAIAAAMSEAFRAAGQQLETLTVAAAASGALPRAEAAQKAGAS